MKGSKEFQVVGIKEWGERIANVTRIITKLKGETTMMMRPEYLKEFKKGKILKYSLLLVLITSCTPTIPDN